MIRCEGKGAPVRGCACPWCLSVYGKPVPETVRLGGPTGDFDDEDRRG